MTKPKKERTVAAPPSVVYFKPQGIPMFQLKKVVIHVEEYEALRLSDVEKLTHAEAADKMDVSRPTFTRIIQSAREKLANAIINGNAIVIEGGSFDLKQNKMRCRSCSFIWDVKSSQEIKCPNCGNEGIINLAKQCGHGQGRKRRRRQ